MAIRSGSLAAILLFSSALVSPAMAQSSGDVVMRRPLPNVATNSTQTGTTPTPTPTAGSGSGTPTPTPTAGSGTPTPTPTAGSGTPTPTPTAGSGSGTPTPTPTAGSGTPTPTPTSTQTCETGSDGCFPHQPDKLATSGYGYNVDCEAHTSTCTFFTNGGSTSAATFDYQNMTYTTDGITCPTAQSADADALAQILGFVTISAGGSDLGLSLCAGGADKPGNTSVYSSYSYCGDGNKSVVYCDRNIFATPFVPGSGRDGTVRMAAADLAICAAQEKNDIWQSLQDQGWGQIDPSTVLTAGGKDCKPWINYNTNAAKCNFDGSATPYTCSSLNITDDGVGHVSLDGRNPTDVSQCADADPNLSSDQLKTLASLGYLPAGPNLAAQCGGAALYGASRVCTSSVTYDAGWPQNGQSHINTGSKVACYAILNKDDPDTLTVQSAPDGTCQSASLSQSDLALLRTLEPDVYPYSELPADCKANVGAPYNYQRDIVGHNAAPTNTGQEDTACGPTIHFKVEYDVPYVCTDSAPGDYYGGVSTGLTSSYPMDRGTCMADHQAELQRINQDIAQNGHAQDIPDSGADLSQLGDTCRQNYGIATGIGGTDVVSDSLSSSKYHVVRSGTCQPNPC